MKVNFRPVCQRCNGRTFIKDDEGILRSCPDCEGTGEGPEEEIDVDESRISGGSSK